MKAKKKKFDAVQMKHDLQAAVQAKIQGMTPEQELEFYKNAPRIRQGRAPRTPRA